MTAKKSPAFQFYPADFLADEKQIVMELAEAGAYIRLICVCWNEGSIPTDARRLAKLCGATTEQIATIWPTLQPCFVEHPKDATRLVHPRLEKERKKQEVYREKMATAGRKGGKKSRRTPSKPPTDPKGNSQRQSETLADARHELSQAQAELKPGSSLAEALAKPRLSLRESSSSSSEVASAVSSSSASETPEPPTPKPTAAGRRVEKSGEGPPPTVGSCALEAFTLLGMGTWGNELSPKFNETKSLIRRQWQGRGVTLESVRNAIRGLRLIIDRGDVEWLADRKGKPIDGLEVLTKNAVVPGPDGTQMASLFSLAERAWRERELHQDHKRPSRGGGPMRLQVEVSGGGPSTPGVPAA